MKTTPFSVFHKEDISFLLSYNFDDRYAFNNCIISEIVFDPKIDHDLTGVCFVQSKYQTSCFVCWKSRSFFLSNWLCFATSGRGKFSANILMYNIKLAGKLTSCWRSAEGIFYIFIGV